MKRWDEEVKKRKKKTPPVSKPSYRWHFSDSLLKENVTEQKFLAYITSFRTIEVIPLKKGEPIFILKNHHKQNNIYGYILDIPSDAKVIIHNNNFIWSDANTYGVGIMVCKTKAKAHPLSVEKVADTDYIKNYKSKAYPSKEFSISSILDKKIPLYGTRYIKPIKDLFRKYGILEEKRRGHRDSTAIVKERREFVKKTLKAIAIGEAQDNGSGGICDLWETYVNTKYKNPDEADKRICEPITIWRDRQELKRFHRK